ncbi:MAG: sigma-54 dependent transcriptional regulator [Deltaproteobacteria bacterium]|nr:sigma-54 dependent transcriptional regulator [Deltaproteobacteria bacterium]
MRTAKRDRLLIIEGHPFIASLLKEIFTKSGFSHVDIWHHSNGLQNSLGNYSLIVLDHSIPNSLDVLQEIRQLSQLPVILLINDGAVSEAVVALRLGATEVVEKPVHPEKIAIALERALSKTSHHEPASRGEERGFQGLIGTSHAMKKIFGLITHIRDSSVNVLITGPSGSGKEMIAAALHHLSPRAGRKFVAINCSAIPDTLLEGELFGYKKGAFTDARTDKVGLFQEADGGTIFLDEIGDMPLSVQPKILRAIQEKEIRPLGGLASIKVDVRIIAATNQNLQERIAQKLFREDLYYRLNAMQIEPPSLSARAEDIPLLAQYFLEKFSEENGRVKRLSDAAMAKLMHYNWPGNVRELENAIERASLMSQGEVIEESDLLFPSAEKKAPTGEIPLADKSSLADIERDYIMQVLNASGGNRSHAAQILQIGRKTLYNKLARYGI